MPYAVVVAGIIAVVSIDGRVKVIWVSYVPNIETGSTGITYYEFFQDENLCLSKNPEEIAFGFIEQWEPIDERRTWTSATHYAQVHRAAVLNAINAMRRKLDSIATQL